MTGLDLTLLRPIWLLGLPLLGLVGYWLWSRQGGVGDWDRATDPGLMRAMAALGQVDATPSRAPLIAALAMVALTLIGLAGPAVERRDTLSFRNLDGVLFVIDASPSAVEDPLWPQALSVGRFGLASLGTRPGGIIVYGGDAYVATDMTLDHLQLGQTFSLIDAETVPDPGSRPERGLALAVQQLEQAEVLAGDVILFSDGAGIGPASLEEAARVSSLGARLSVVSFGGSPTEAQSLVRVGGGRVFSLDETDALSEWLSEDARTRLAAQDYPLLFWSDLGRYVLVLALVPLFLLFRREGA